MPTGDTLSLLLEKIGVTPDRVSRWLGRECRCKERRERLNRLHYWVRRVVRGQSSSPKEELEQVIREDDTTDL